MGGKTVKATVFNTTNPKANPVSSLGTGSGVCTQDIFA
eukprot:CAMPEP_0202862742 /NCGR_PEP_ID=MMETSP1391-20130828/3673_1 /ASSEMBLY_ACC=CAM_ASM_000867 /TAXON_ID=1034604 /ORGANISM="Chlamydomonas leiostraca, Strain SAG 11-49" /LENGTH=37 /DNA_ID= /DNA_START= /DNA_END= /DNA_ORIENTATION=